MLVFGVVAVIAATSQMPAFGAELIMFEQRGCPFCAQWDREIAPAYPKTQEGRVAPLRRVDIHEAIPADLAGIAVERFTPTFVVVDHGREIGRIRGYPGSDFFWFLLDNILDTLPATVAAPATSS